MNASVMSELPIPRVENWQALYEPGARAKCIKDNPPMYGFGSAIRAGEIVEVRSVCWSGTKYQISVDAQCAFYDLEGYFEPVIEFKRSA